MDRIVVKLGAVLYVCWDLLHLHRSVGRFHVCVSPIPTA